VDGLPGSQAALTGGREACYSDDWRRTGVFQDRVLRAADGSEGGGGSSEPAQPIRAKFRPGSILSTPGVLTSVPPQDLLAALTRHLSGDWGNLDAHDWEANESALRHEGRLFSAFDASNGVRFWIITEADRSATTALLPDEY
jgi:hypothetical protein